MAVARLDPEDHEKAGLPVVVLDDGIGTLVKHASLVAPTSRISFPAYLTG